jgi:GT2 family glycosyltransferase
MDSDDLIERRRLETLIEAADRDGADIVADNLLTFEEMSPGTTTPVLTGKQASSPFWVGIADYVRLNHLYGAGPKLGYLKPIFRASAFFAQANRYDEKLRIAEDYDLVLRLLHLGFRLRIYPIGLYFHRKHAASTSHRLSERAIGEIIAADARFRSTAKPSDPDLVAALKSRTKDLHIALAYEKLLNSLRVRNWSAAIAAAWSNPQCIFLLRLPIGVRLARWVRFPHSGKRIKSGIDLGAPSDGAAAGNPTRGSPQ